MRLTVAKVQMQYMTDGTPASIAADIVTVLEVYPEKANITWITTSLLHLLGSPIAAINLPSTYPGSTNPMLWWTTPNMEVVAAAFVESGKRIAN
jgi:hypothetical protein